MENSHSVTIACPVSNRAWILPYYLDHLYDIDYPKEKINLYFLLNNTTDNSQEIIENFKTKYNHEYNNIDIDIYKTSQSTLQDQRTAEVRDKMYGYLSKLRNQILLKCETDYLLSCDSDILVSSDVLIKLLSHKKEIVAGLIWNGYLFSPETPWRFPNILKYNQNGEFEHIQNYYVKNAPSLIESKLVEVDASGALILMQKNVYQSTAYSYHKQGEDMAWSEDCKNKGFKIYCDVSCFGLHVMDQDMLEKCL